MKAGLLVTVLTILLFVGIFLASGLVLMLLVNVVLGYYDAKQLDYGVALAVNLLLWLFGGAVRTSGKD